MMDKKILFFDIDGTLIDDKTDVVPESVPVALQKAKKNGHLLFLCSGRCRAIIPEDIIALGFDGMVGGCGTYIEMNGKEIYHHTLPAELQKAIIEDLKECHIDGVLEGKRCSAFRRKPWMPAVKSIFVENGTLAPKQSFVSQTQCFWDETFSFDKMALWYDETSDMKTFKEKYEEQFEFIERDPTFYEAVPKGISKATGIRRVCEQVGMDIQDSIAFGDSMNDVSMLQCTGYSVAMGDGNPMLFDKVDYVTTAVLDDGIANALKYLKIIED